MRVTLTQSLFPSYDTSPKRPSQTYAALRAEVRAFLAAEEQAGRFRRGRQSWPTFDRAFSKRCAERGYIAMTWPRAFGGHERHAFERYVVCEEMLAAGAPLGAHWIADRQSGPQIMRHGCEALKAKILPQIAAGTCTFGIGMSEPESGSDLASIRTTAVKVEGGWRLNGRKVWTTNAQHAQYMIVLARTEPSGGVRYKGLSQLVVPLDASGVTVRPIRNIAAQDEFNEVIFDGNFVPADHLLGKGGDGWNLVTEELAFERSGPDRILSTFVALSALAEAAGATPDRLMATELGRLIAQLVTIRDLSLAIAERLDAGKPATGLATIMKDLGTTLEQEIAEVARRLIDVRPSLDGGRVEGVLATALLTAPSFSLRGGTREILKGIIARELGLR